MSMRSWRYVSILLLALWSPVFGLAANDEFEKADIYYINWGVLARGRLTLDSVRRNAMIRTNIVDSHEASTFARWLQLSNMTHARHDQKKVGDPRLVIDLWDASGNRTTYYSNGMFLINEDGSEWRAVNREFLLKFTFADKW